MEITIWGVLTGAILPLFGYLAFHYLASSREQNSRHAQACNDFREKIIVATSNVPDPSVYWDNEVLMSMPKTLKDIENGVEIFKYFLSSSRQEKFLINFSQLKQLAENEIPDALSRENVMYAGGQHTPKEARELYWEKVEELKNYANKN